jgi:predicted membrane-bound dolichyl-phosphate-mannose-protein mannosyltransferase
MTLCFLADALPSQSEPNASLFFPDDYGALTATAALDIFLFFFLSLFIALKISFSMRCSSQELATSSTSRTTPCTPLVNLNGSERR